MKEVVTLGEANPEGFGWDLQHLRHTFTQIIGSSHRHERPASRGSLKPWRSCLTVWDSKPIWKRLWGWLGIHVMRLGVTLRRPKSSGWQGRYNTSGNGSTRESAALNVTWIWKRGIWQPTDKSRTGWTRGIWRNLPPPTTGQGHYLPDIVPVGRIWHRLTSERVPGLVNKPQRTPGKLRAPQRAGHSSDPGGEYPRPLELHQVWHVCHMEGA